MRLFVAFIFFVIFSFQCFAQKENNNWYFGLNTGITFNNGSPVALASSAMNTIEGTISVSDSMGNLLFYSDGTTVWNRNHVPMLNGRGLLGHFSSTQSVLAVPKPGSKTIYYIFTVDAVEHNLLNGLRYSILDMSLDGGLGGITNTKNVLLKVPVTEKLIAVRHGNNKDYWVLAHKWNSDEFLAYELTSAGLSNTSVLTKIGSIHGGSFGNATCQMKANRKGTQIALVISELHKVELFDFNAFTGMFSNVQSTSLAFEYPYGIEFSGDCTKLYVTAQNNFKAYILQCNLNDTAALNAFIPIKTSNYSFNGLQIGPDGKIYCATLNSNFLGVITDPDSLALACNFNSNGASLNGIYNIYGLPNMLIPAHKNVFGRLDTIQCLGDSLTLGQEAISGNSYLWQDSSTKSTFLVTKPGKYKLKVRNWYLDGEYEFNVQFQVCAPVIPDIPLVSIIPNIISPNQDKLNDAFVLQGFNAADFELQIFNRWGNLVYKTESYQNDWDARGNSAGMYYYLLRNPATGATYKGWLEVVK